MRDGARVERRYGLPTSSGRTFQSFAKRLDGDERVEIAIGQESSMFGLQRIFATQSDATQLRDMLDEILEDWK